MAWRAQTVTLFREGPAQWPAGRDAAPPNHRAILALPLIAVFVGLAFAGLMALIRRLALFTMPFESIENLQVATVRGCVAGAVVVVGGIAVLNGGRRLRDVVAALDAGATHLGMVGAVVTALAEIGLVALAAWRGHGTLSVITALVAGQVALVWAIHWSGSTLPWGGSRGPVTAKALPRSYVTTMTVGSMIVPQLILTSDDDPRRNVLPFAMAAVPVAVAVSGAFFFQEAQRPAQCRAPLRDGGGGGNNHCPGDHRHGAKLSHSPRSARAPQSSA